MVNSINLLLVSTLVVSGSTTFASPLRMTNQLIPTRSEESVYGRNSDEAYLSSRARVPPPKPAKPAALQGEPLNKDPEHRKKWGETKWGEIIGGYILPAAAALIPTGYMVGKAIYQKANGQNITRRAEPEDMEVSARSFDQEIVSPRDADPIGEYTLRAVGEIQRRLSGFQQVHQLEFLD